MLRPRYGEIYVLWKKSNLKAFGKKSGFSDPNLLYPWKIRICITSSDQNQTMKCRFAQKILENLIFVVVDTSIFYLFTVFLLSHVSFFLYICAVFRQFVLFSIQCCIIAAVLIKFWANICTIAKGKLPILPHEKKTG